MADSDDYGDEFDDTEFLYAATQAERENTPSAFQPSPRPAKRRKVNQTVDDRPKPIPRHHNQQSAQRRRRGPFISSDDDDDDDDSDAITRCSLTSSGSESTHDSPHVQENHRDAQHARRKQRTAARRKHVLDSPNQQHSPVKETVAQKRKERIHVPTTHLDMTDMFYTQPPQEHSPPWKPRGAIWAKSKTTIGVHKPNEPARWTALDAMKTMSLPGRNSLSSRPQPQAPPSPGTLNSPVQTEPSPQLPLVNAATIPDDFTLELEDLPSDAFASSSSSSPQKQPSARKQVVAPQASLRQTTLFGRAAVNADLPPSQAKNRYSFVQDQKEEPPTHHKLNPVATRTWVYPTNLGTIRDYQFNIVQRGLFNNLLVALPTGLGKTFIAATIMLNWYRWTVDSQIVFVAPTKPLVAQQVQACFKIAGIPRSATTMLTGNVQTGLRAEEWKEKRVFFMTPQTLQNDLKSGYADPKKIVLLVVDEAHRATGGYAYVEIVSFLRRFNDSFRVLALTATPGANVEAVQKVIDGLDISRVEIRTENSMDICSYVHQRSVEKKVFQNSDEMEMCMDLYRQALQPLVNTISGLNAYWSKDPCDLTPYGCQQAKSKWTLEAGRHANQGVKSIVHAVFAILSSISQGMELLKYHGIGPFHVKMKDFQNESQKSKSKYRKQILDSDAWKKLMSRLQGWMTDDNFVGHPKMEYLQEAILEHFANAEDGHNANGASSSQTRVMVFANFRDSTDEIARILKRHEPMIRPRVFVGQAAGKNSEGMTQKDQLDVIEKFKSGVYNTLIATSIGEEGLDIGEVDLIICYDSKASPIRMLQRMGRTGRKREGKIIMLQMNGKEENDANKAKDSYEKMQELIAKGSHFNFHDDKSRRILPPDVKPVVDRRVVEIPPENSQYDWLPEPKKGRRSKKPPKKFHMPDNVITGFVTAGRMGEELVSKGRGKKVATPVYPSEEIIEVPSLESVVLDDAGLLDLERRYQTVFDDDDAPMVGALNLGLHPERQRALIYANHNTGPGRATRAFAATMQRMHDVDSDRVESFKNNLHYSDYESDISHDYLVSDAEPAPAEMDDADDPWADDDPASQTLPTIKVTKAKPGPKPKPKTMAKETDESRKKAKATPKTPAARGRPRKEALAVETPIRQSKATSATPHTATPNWRATGLAQEGEESSPPPTDPRFHIASQADTVGSDDTLGEDEVEDTQAYLMDSELASFIVEDGDVEVPASSLPSLDLHGVGQGTQAIVKAAQPKRTPRREKIFTSDVTDDDAVVSSDSDDEVSLVKSRAGTSKKAAVIVADSDSEGGSEEEERVLPRIRQRRVIDDEEDDD
ncbi:hypothetical protein IAQ61_004161 [Plenodomus lingam]|uniref:ATP-dependent DNA helicase n=1 Tax=Leptosphaeria maculans (strain JN3 / isolate v23.1.3 / race Av1-4-5-6-7-8) TaxID=985895 RepID=E4ZXD1_LEPMJ|nr:hypothetical protein LEMA_P024930.1 [Plenodomus lingam JN3]KAH9873537.1 hypothetical protein IAQ61_004161 [Plenodomus lingam]CBX95341.1 hypothetical protein LEMA_P024930.1 [Plenodomus lingam JN3]